MSARVALLPLFLAACGGDGDTADAGAVGRGLTGTLHDEEGAPLPRAQVLGCMADVCLYTDTDGEGRFRFEIDPPALVAVKTVEELSSTPRRGATLCPVEIQNDEPIDVGRVYVPALPAGVPFGSVDADPQTLQVGDGLELILRRGDLTPRVGDALVDAAARAIPPERRPPFEALGGAEIVAVYALHPFAAKSASPIVVRAPASLPAGTRVTFWTVSEIDGTFSPPVGGVSDGASVTTDPGEGIDELTWLVITKEP